MQNKNEKSKLILAVAISFIILLSWTWFVDKPKMEEQNRLKAQQKIELLEKQKIERQEAELKQGVDYKNPNINGEDVVIAPVEEVKIIGKDEALKKDERIVFENEAIKGSINLTGLKIDDLVLKKYNEELNGSKAVTLLSPINTENEYFVDFGWVSSDESILLPNTKTLWKVKGENTSDKIKLSQNKPIVFEWSNQEGLIFEVAVKLDENYMLDVKQSVINNTGNGVALTPYSRISRIYNPKSAQARMVFSGILGVIDHELEEIKYKDVKKHDSKSFDARTQWVGFNDPYWFTAFRSNPNHKYTTNLKYQKEGELDLYTIENVGKTILIGANSREDLSNQFFAGAKEIKVLDGYSKDYDIKLFDRNVDFGWFYFITKPMYLMLKAIFGFVGNFGVAIILLTLIVRSLMLPTMNKSYTSMQKMKTVQPKLKHLQQKYANNKLKLNQEMMKLYKEEGVSPASGCLPMIIQIPIFFSLYKVLYVAIDMRHAPFFGWLKDLSIADPSSIFNLFGLLPYGVPAALQIGILPILVGISMYLQQLVTPKPDNETYAKAMKYMPWMFVLMFARLPAGLLLYWTCGNVFSLGQQYYIHKKLTKSNVTVINR